VTAPGRRPSPTASLPRRILIVGSGGREHALARALRGPAVELLCAPGNPGTARLGRGINRAVAADDVSGLVALARAERIDLVVPGPEACLAAGLADALAAEPGILCCGPTQAAARLESSKAFARALCSELAVPSPQHRVVTARHQIRAALRAFARPPVVKADGLCGGKGAFLPDSFAACAAQIEALLDGSLGAAGRTVVLEERLDGVEASLFFACHGEALLALPHARDYKRLCDGERGPNTGGMGAISPCPHLTGALVDEVGERMVRPVLRALRRAGTPFVGFLFVGLMLTAAGPRLLEYNVRLGDPEAQVILPRLARGALLSLCTAVARGELAGAALPVDDRPTCAVVLAAPGYPSSARTGTPIELDPALEAEDRDDADPARWFIHAGTRREGGRLVVSGGRVGALVARGSTPQAARAAAYDALPLVRFAGRQVRSDIGSEPEPAPDRWGAVVAAPQR
jgi:phosphoribosylamine--glycine ligase